MSIELTHEGCGHEWEYGGDRNPGEYVTCPRCYSKLKIPEGVDA